MAKMKKKTPAEIEDRRQRARRAKQAEQAEIDAAWFDEYRALGGEKDKDLFLMAVKIMIDALCLSYISGIGDRESDWKAWSSQHGQDEARRIFYAVDSVTSFT